jgi:hypothetical protein
VFKQNCGKPKEIGGQQKKRLPKKIVGTKIKWGDKKAKRLQKIIGKKEVIAAVEIDTKRAPKMQEK